jgi:hypothetical protein
MGFSGNCIACHTRDELQNICVKCAKKLAPLSITITENVQNGPVKTETRVIAGPPKDTLRKCLERLKEEMGYGVKEIHQEPRKAEESL